MDSIEGNSYTRMVKNARPRLAEARMIVFAEYVQIRTEHYYDKIHSFGRSAVSFLIPGGAAAMNGVANLSINFEQGTIEREF